MTPMTSRHIQVPPIRVIICHTYNQVTQQTRAKHNTACAFSISWLLLFRLGDGGVNFGNHHPFPVYAHVYAIPKAY